MRTRKIFIVALVLSLWASTFGPSLLGTVMAQQTFNFPTAFSQTAFGPFSVGNTAGTVNNGGRPVTVAAASNAVTASRNDCREPNFPSCNILYADNAGTVAVTSGSGGYATAMRSQNTVLAFVETSASAVTQVIYPQQTSYVSRGGALLTDCVSSATCAAPVTYAGASVRVVAGTATFATGTVTVSGISPAFVNSGSYGCTAVFASGTSAGVDPILFTPVSATSFTMAASGGTTQNIFYTCVGR